MPFSLTLANYAATFSATKIAFESKEAFFKLSGRLEGTNFFGQLKKYRNKFGISKD
jgi:hypothetical protein